MHETHADRPKWRTDRTFDPEVRNPDGDRRMTETTSEYADFEGLTGARTAAFGKTSIKKHIPKTNRKNVGENHYGCLAVGVPKSAEPYRRIEGSWYGIVLGASPASRRDVRFSRN
ncbi:hypothetical protein [Streptomyces sp. NPDC059611]|uniref:hypothetical protein n=1 Tax=Streptomyces sp. NPDC059611 TaxID=3346884 RepID=UPI0036871C65